MAQIVSDPGWGNVLLCTLCSPFLWFQTEQYINDRPAFIAAARAATRKYATAASSSDAKPTKGEEETEDPTSSERASEAEASCKHDGSEEQAAKRQKIDPSTQ